MKQVFGLGKREIGELLRKKGINPTTQRVEVAFLFMQKPQHLSAEEVFQKINKEYEQVSQATIYNTLRLFVDKGVLRELVFSSDRIIYDSNIGLHHHFIDTDSGKIYDVPAEALSFSNINISGIEADIEEISLLIRGRIRRQRTAHSV
jgi:Fur family transcriptional regulator, iron response regulator